MAFLGIGKKKAPAAPKAAAVAVSGEAEGAAESSEAPAPSKGRTKVAAPEKPKAKARKVSGELDIYTVVLVAAFIALTAGCVLIAMDNLTGVEGTGDEGNPFALVSSN